MSDERLRELERTWRQSGAVDDEVAFLRERVRVGALEEPRVQLAAWLGHPAAERLAPAATFVVPPRGGLAVEAFWSGVLLHGDQVAVRGILAEARRATRRVREALDGEEAKLSRSLVRLRAILGADGPLSDPAERHASGWWRATMQVVESATAWVLAPGDDARAGLASDLERVAVGSVPSALYPTRPRRVVSAMTNLMVSVLQLDQTLAGIARAPWSAINQVDRLLALRATMCAEVAPWALGTGDVLRDELQGRLDRIQIASPCRADWDAMTPIGSDGRTRHCASCNLAVHDLAAYSATEVDALLRQREGRRLCVNLYRRADGRVLTRDCPTGLSARVTPTGGLTMRGGIG